MSLDSITSQENEIGDLVKGRGVYLGKYAGLAAYAALDFLRDGNGKQLLLNFFEANAELTLRNEGRSYGNGSAKALRQAIRTGAYRDGDLVLPPKELLNGKDANDDKVRPGENIYDLLGKPVFNTTRKRISNGKDDRWVVSSSERPSNPSRVDHVSLSSGDDGWSYKHGYRSGVVPLRFFKPTRGVGG